MRGVVLVVLACALALTANASATSDTAAYRLRGTAALGAVLHLQGTRVWCSVQRYGGGPAVLCFNRKGNKGVPGTYAFIASDAAITVTQFDARGHGSVAGRFAEPTFAGVTFPGPGAKNFELAFDDIVKIAGTHFACRGGKSNRDNRPTMYCEARDAGGSVLTDTYGASVSEGRVGVGKFSASGPQVVFDKAF
jgi:hypothetical protein